MGTSILRTLSPAIVVMAICAVVNFNPAEAQEENQARALSMEDAGRPTLGDLMSLIQLRHFKLWYAHLQGNWGLAAYELGQFRTTFSRIATLYPSAKSISQANTIRERTAPALSELFQAINDRNSSRFKAAYVQITDACNQCHQAAGVGFIVVKVPTRSPFSNQDFRAIR
jgi:hypothetical protein